MDRSSVRRYRMRAQKGGNAPHTTPQPKGIMALLLAKRTLAVLYSCVMGADRRAGVRPKVRSQQHS